MTVARKLHADDDEISSLCCRSNAFEVNSLVKVQEMSGLIAASSASLG